MDLGVISSAGVQGKGGGKGLASRRQKVNHRKALNLRRRTDLSMDRETDAEKWFSVGKDVPIYGTPRRRAHRGFERCGSVVRPQEGYNPEILSYLS